MTAQPPAAPDQPESAAAAPPTDLGALVRGLAESAASPPAAPALSSFDLDAAWLRRAEADGAGFLARFARIVTEALPHHASLETVRRGLFRKSEEVVGLSVAFDDETYRMRLSERQQIVTEVEKCVRGVRLSTKPTHAHAWMRALLARVHERTASARSLAELLRSL